MDKEYRVLKIDEMSRLAEVGGIEKYYRHQIKTKGGVVLTINISEKDFTPELSAPILLKAAQNADEILAL
ncbi:hypothetical protein ES708_01562 [subsurface metagenome]